MSETPSQRLARLMNARRVRLQRRWNTVAELAGMDPSNLRRIRRGEIEVTDFAAAQIERGLDWEPGSVAAILAGGLPTEKAAPSRRLDWDLPRDETEREMLGLINRGLSEDTVWEAVDERRAREHIAPLKEDDHRVNKHDSA